MIYIMEDRADDILSQLYMVAYTNKENKHWVGGNGFLVEKAEYYLKNTNDTVAVFMNTIPGNISCKIIYRNLLNLGKKYPNRLIVMPIICSEYYFIKALCKMESVIMHNKDVLICIKKGNFKKSALYNKDDDMKNVCKNFEKYCKLILIKYVRDCIKYSRGYGNTINDAYGIFYKEDCKCNKCDKHCRERSLVEKSIRYLSEYVCVPADANSTNKEGISIDKAKLIHRYLVDQFNKFSDKYDKLGITDKHYRLAYMY